MASKGSSSPTMEVFLFSLHLSPAHITTPAPLRPPLLSQAWLKPAKCRSDKEGMPDAVRWGDGTELGLGLGCWSHNPSGISSLR